MDTLVYVPVRHREMIQEIKEKGGYATTGKALTAILDAAMPRIKLVKVPQYYISLDGDVPEDGGDE